MEIEPLTLPESDLTAEHESLDPRPEVDMLLSEIGRARERDEQLSPLLTDIVNFMREYPEERFALHEQVPEGRLMQEDQPISDIYVLLRSEKLPVASKSVDIGGVQDEIELGTIRLPTIIGEISKLLDGKATANVDLTAPTTLLTLSDEQFRRMSNSPSFKNNHTDLANERLQRQLDIMDTVTGTRGTEEYRAALAEQIGVTSALEDALQEGSSRRIFTLEGTNRDTGTYKQQEFIASFERTADNMVRVDITGSEDGSRIDIPLKVSDGGKYVSTGRRAVFMGEVDGYGFYSKILGAFLAHAKIFESEATEPTTTNVIDGYTSGYVIANSVLAAESKLIAARPSDFISYVRGKEYQITSYRVDEQLSRILRLTKDVEKDLLKPSKNILMEKYRLPKKDVSRILLQLTTQYMGSESPQQLPQEAQDALDAQVNRIKELCSEA